MDTLAARGTGRAGAVPPGMYPGSDVAVMSVLGFDPAKYYTGRAPLEAPAMGVELEPGQIAYRMNLVTIFDSKMSDFTAGHISNDEAGHSGDTKSKKEAIERIDEEVLGTILAVQR